MRHQTSIEIFNYWSRIKGTANAPLRAQIEPASIRHVLPQIFILETTAIGQPRFRLAGTMVCSLFGRELRDDAFSTLWSGSQRDNAVSIAQGVMTHAVPALLNATGSTASGRTMAFEILLLPMRSTVDSWDRLLGCLVPTSSAGWFGSEPMTSLTLDRSRLLSGWTSAADPATPEPKTPKSGLAYKGVELRHAVRRALHRHVFEGGRTG